MYASSTTRFHSTEIGRHGANRTRDHTVPNGALYQAELRAETNRENGWQGWTRTIDPAINSRLLYQLSYMPMRKWGRIRARYRPGLPAEPARFVATGSNWGNELDLNQHSLPYEGSALPVEPPFQERLSTFPRRA